MREERIVCCHTSLRVKANLKQRSMAERPLRPSAGCCAIRAQSGCGCRLGSAYITSVCPFILPRQKSRQNDKIDKMATVESSYATFKLVN